MKENNFDQFIIKGNKKLRYGYTTGTCATAASKACALMLLSKDLVEKVTISTPKGFVLDLDCKDIWVNKDKISCAIEKDSGDDPDVTNGIWIYTEVSLINENKILITGGEGVGIITKKGLENDVGQFAINSGPKKMITAHLLSVKKQFGYEGGFKVVIYVPKGKEIAKKTYNSKLGIIDGISILGTTGIVEPMSEKAILETIKLEMNVIRKKNVKILLLYPGNYGKEFAEEFLGFKYVHAVKISNFIKDVFIHATKLNFEQILLVGHIGKLSKVSLGISNTHSKYGDGRMESILSIAILHGIDCKKAELITNAVTTDEMIDLLKENNLYESVCFSMANKIQTKLKEWTENKVDIGVVLFNKKIGLLGQNINCKVIAKNMKEVINND